VAILGQGGDQGGDLGPVEGGGLTNPVYRLRVAMVAIFFLSSGKGEKKEERR